MKDKVGSSREAYYSKEESRDVKSRINLNDLLKKVKDREKEEKKTNLMILSGVLSVAVIIFLIISF